MICCICTGWVYLPCILTEVGIRDAPDSEFAADACCRLLSCIFLQCNSRLLVVQEGPIYTFVAIVPVTMDALFKYWIFKGLNGKNPAAAVTLKNMDRH